jgi:hypothetical protein
MSKNQVLKECRGCGESLPLDNFGRNKSSKDGHQTRCKSCFKNYRTKPRVKQSQHFSGEIPKPKLNRTQILQQIEILKRRESNPNTASGYDFSFLFTNTKFKL